MENLFIKPKEGNNLIEPIQDNYFIVSHQIPSEPNYKRVDNPGIYLNDFEAKLMRTLICPLCKKSLEEPVTDPCGHSFCCQCIFQARKVSNICPINNKEYETKKVA